MERFSQEGFDAFGQGKSRSDNPYYLTDQKAAAEWNAGWFDGYEMEEQNKRDRNEQS